MASVELFEEGEAGEETMKKPSMDLKISDRGDSGRSIVGEVIQQSTVRDPWGTRASFVRGFMFHFSFFISCGATGRPRPTDRWRSERKREKREMVTHSNPGPHPSVGERTRAGSVAGARSGRDPFGRGRRDAR